jgi:hypothetical protein
MKVDSISRLTYMQGMMQTSRAANPDHATQTKGHQPEVAPPDNGLTGAERAFFSKLFPGSAQQIGAHKTYTPMGFNAPVELGQIINRKG